MSVMADEPRRPGDSDRHRQQRSKNLFMFFFLLSMAVIFIAEGEATLILPRSGRNVDAGPNRPAPVR